MRRIDLCCKLMAPVVVGAVITYTDYFTSTLVVAGWNIMSFFAEFGLLCVVYYCIPTLARKKYRKSVSLIKSSEGQGDGEDEGEVVTEKLVTSDVDEGGDDNVFVVENRQSKSCKQKCTTLLAKLIVPYTTVRDGWKIYARQEIARVGIAMSLLYVTVLGFHDVSAAYFKIQGLTEVMIGVFQGVGGIIAIIGTFVYVPLRKRVGTVRAGLFGMCAQIFMLLFCVAGVFAPGNHTETGGEDYYSPYCPTSPPASTTMISNTIISNLTVSVTITPSHTITASLPNITTTSTYLMNTTVMLMPTPLPTEDTGSGALDSSYSVYSYSYSINPHSNTSTGTNNNSEDSTQNTYTISLILLLIGVLGARFGLWMFDLSVSQLLQERVIEEERGVVSGVMNVFIASSDMLHYLLAIAAPDPKYFGILALISVGFVGCGLLLYASYVHKVRGHLFHFADAYRRIKGECHTDRQIDGTINLISVSDKDEGIEDDEEIEDAPDEEVNL